MEDRRGIGFGVVEEGRRLCCMIKGYGGEYVAMGRGAVEDVCRRAEEDGWCPWWLERRMKEEKRD